MASGQTGQTTMTTTEVNQRSCLYKGTLVNLTGPVFKFELQLLETLFNEIFYQKF